MKYLYLFGTAVLLGLGYFPEPPDLTHQLFFSGLAICLMLFGVIDAIEESRKWEAR